MYFKCLGFTTRNAFPIFTGDVFAGGDRMLHEASALFDNVSDCPGGTTPGGCVSSTQLSVDQNGRASVGKGLLFIGSEWQCRALQAINTPDISGIKYGATHLSPETHCFVSWEYHWWGYPQADCFTEYLN